MSEEKEPIHFTIAINRFVDISLTFFNSLVALMLLTAPWYKITLDLAGADLFHGCALTRGTVIAPFASGICQFDTMTGLPGDEGKQWKTMHNYVITYLAFALLISSFVGYESTVHGLRKWNNANTLSFGLNFVTLILQTMILIEEGSISKPKHIENELATTMIIAALAMSCIRIPVLGYFMYHTYNFDKENGGYFGTGGRV